MAHAAPQPSAHKWVAGLSSATPAADAARLVLAARLSAADVAARRAAEAVTDPEAVHQLRVSTRRARAALAAFADLLPRKAVKKARNTLGKLRRAAGAVRDLDVLLAAVNDLPSRGMADPAGALFLSGYLVARQSAERRRFLQSLTRLLEGKRLRRLVSLPDRVRGDEVPLEGRAAEVLVDVASRFGDALAGEADPSRLHQVRIVGKEFRYGLEIFVDCYATAVRDKLYAAVEKLQEILGRANDARQALRAIDALREELAVTRPDLDRQIGRHLKSLAGSLQKRLAEEQKKFDRWRKQWPGLRATERLARPLPAAVSDEGIE